MKTLLILSHPNLATSVANKTVIEELKKSSQDITIRHLEELYQGYTIDVAADTIIFQFPFYWYSSPPALKNWIDQVLGYNFAYGPEGDKIKGKNLIISTTLGGPQEAYLPLGYNHFRVGELLRPFEQTAYLTGLNYIEPIFTHRCVFSPEANNKAEVEERARNHATRVLEQIAKLV
jgi:putative NADPH-quinone reductase